MHSLAYQNTALCGETTLPPSTSSKQCGWRSLLKGSFAVDFHCKKVPLNKGPYTCLHATTYNSGTLQQVVGEPHPPYTQPGTGLRNSRGVLFPVLVLGQVASSAVSCERTKSWSRQASASCRHMVRHTRTARWARTETFVTHREVYICTCTLVQTCLT